MGSGRHHDRELLDALDAAEAEAFDGRVWRVTGRGRDVLRGSTAGGRWSAAGEFEVLYTSLAQQGALDEIGYRLSLEPVWPSRAEHDVHQIAARTSRSLRFANLDALLPLGVDAARYVSFDYQATQAIAAAAHFLGYDGLIVPSARSPALNLVIFLERLPSPDGLTVVATDPVDWQKWRAGHAQRERASRRLTHALAAVDAADPARSDAHRTGRSAP